MQVFKPDSRAVGGGTGKPGVLQSTGSQRVRHDLVTENQQEEGGTKGRREGFLFTPGLTFSLSNPGCTLTWSKHLQAAPLPSVLSTHFLARASLGKLKVRQVRAGLRSQVGLQKSRRSGVGKETIENRFLFLPWKRVGQGQPDGIGRVAYTTV